MQKSTTTSRINYVNPDWEDILVSMGIVSFDDWWNQGDGTAKSVDPVNRKSDDPSAWSKVSALKTPCGRTLFLKRQENFYPNNTIHKWRKQLTFEREYLNYQKIRKADVPTYELVAFHSRKQGGNRQAVYVCEGLEGFTSLMDLIEVWNRNGYPKTSQRKKMLDVLVDTVLHMHRNGILHNALSPRHMFFNIPNDDPYAFPEKMEIRLIDFEGVKVLKKGSDKAIHRDLFSLNRRCTGWPVGDRIRALRQYLGVSRLDADAKKTVRTIAKRTQKLNACKTLR